MRTIRRMLTTVVLGAGVFVASNGEAQQIRYMDSSGNIHFVDSLSDVPKKYRTQVVPPTPTPVLDARAQAEQRRQAQLAERQRQQEARRKEQEERVRKAQAEREAYRKQKELKRQEMSSGFQKGGL